MNVKNKLNNLRSLFRSPEQSLFKVHVKNNVQIITTPSGMKFFYNDKKHTVTLKTPNANSIVICDNKKAIKIKDDKGNRLDLTYNGITLNSEGNINIRADGDINIEGNNIKLNASAQLSAEGSAGAKLSSSSKTEVIGAIVSIN